MCSAGIAFISISLQENISFFYYPSELLIADVEQEKIVRLGGVVVPGSIFRNESGISFAVTDDKEIIKVFYMKKVLPNLFREDSGVVVVGYFINGTFIANNILAKHNEKYKSAAKNDIT